MPKNFTQKSLILRSRTEKPYFELKSQTINYNSSDPLIKVLCFSVDPVCKSMKNRMILDIMLVIIYLAI
jgi:hypothetical protein